MRYLILLLSLSIGLSGCGQYSNDNTGSAYLGGEIINPKSDYVVVFNRDIKLADTLKLDANNRFIHKFENISPSVYSFFHGGEYQLVILEPSDSIMLRLNTFGFDESLVFTGEGARKNNYLIKTFIDNEIERKKLVKYSQKEPEEFAEFIEKKHENALTEFEEFVNQKEISEFSTHIIKSSIDYHYYANKEIYPFAYFGYNKLVHVKDLPENFYDYRADVNYNDKDLDEIWSYNRFLSSHIDNLALEKYYNENAYHSKFNRHELSYNLARLDLIDSLVSDTTIKNYLLRDKAREFISHSNNDEEVNTMLTYYSNKTNSEEDKVFMKTMVESIKKLRPGHGIPELQVLNTKKENFKISDVVNRTTLIYFWSSNYIQHYRNSHYRVKELREKFPEMAFISINTDNNTDAYWIDTLNKYKFSIEDEYRFENPRKALKTLAVNYVYKVIIVDKKSHIIHPNVNIFSDDFEILLQDLNLKKELSL